MSITLDTASGPVTAEELFRDYRKGIGGQGPYVEKKYLIAWEHSDAFANALMGISSVIGGPDGTVMRTNPHICPESTNLWALDVLMEPEGDAYANNGRPTYSHAIASVLYGVPTYSFDDNRNDPTNLHTFDGQAYPYCTMRFDYSTETLTLPETSYKFASGTGITGKPVGQPLGIRIGISSLVCTVHAVPFLPRGRITARVGKVNDATFFGEPAGYILFEGARTTIEKSSNGTKTQDLELSFKFRSQKWNQLPNPNDGSTWVDVTHDGTSGGNKLYATADMRPLLFGVNLS